MGSVLFNSLYRTLAVLWLVAIALQVRPVVGQKEFELSAAVGVDAANQPADVRWVQQRLNEVPTASGGPTEALAVDGLVGPKTIAAIKRFQKIQLALEDGIVEPGKPTDQRLRAFANFESQPRPGRELLWGKRVTSAFKAKLLKVAEAIETDPDHLMAAMAFETAESFSPAIKNAAGSGATGLIQFMPSTAQGLGTSTDALAGMSAEEQLDYVQKYFQPYRGRCQRLSDVYMAILWPVAVGKPEDHVLFDRQTRPKTYTMNRGLDLNQDGKITKAEAAAKVQAKAEKGKGFRG